ncbi:MAG: TonB C-terminal domain-containing protein [Candidatus Eisenbacteria bacterium]|uniref:TonB C-terminal domain-containing protein n=1 Tax=Eiseniibacteriota bacterium TaxID=2212470 RepID=A0A937X914_UNCEI|nr:TonB C-terminal domain-containing protein [Candidatus Eisenbacteria bacterium]
MRLRRAKGPASPAAPKGREWQAWLFGRRLDGGRREPGLGGCLRLSIALHAAAVLVLAWLPSWSRPVRWENPALVVSLYTLPEETPAPRPAPREEPARPPERPRPKPPEPKRDEGPKEVVKEKPKPAPQQPPEARAPAPSTKPPAPDSPAPPEPTGPVTMNVRVEEAQFVYDYYLQALVAKISQAWRPPAGVAAGQGLNATLKFRITAQGRVPSVEVETSSRLDLFDRSAVEAVQRAQPLPPFPPAYQGRWLTVHLKFTFQE